MEIREGVAVHEVPEEQRSLALRSSYWFYYRNPAFIWPRCEASKLFSLVHDSISMVLLGAATGLECGEQPSRVHAPSLG